MISAIELIKRVAEAGANIAEVYVDTVGPPEKYQARLSEIFPDYKITVSMIELKSQNLIIIIIWVS